jgi:hypothetical protein
MTMVHTLPRSQPPGWTGYARRVDHEMLTELGPSPAERPRAYVCAPTPFRGGALIKIVRNGSRLWIGFESMRMLKVAV